MAGRIFINYRRDDSASQALNVAQYLENTFGKSKIFIDIDRLRAGQKFPTVLEDTLGQCKVMLAIIGPNWLDVRDDKTGARRLDNPEDWVRLEIERSLARNIPVIPILVAGATLPAKDDLPSSLQALIEHQNATVTTNGFRHEMAGLARDVTELMGRRPWRAIAAAAGLAMLGLGYFAAYQLGAQLWVPWVPGTVQPDRGAADKTKVDGDAKRVADAAESARKARAAAEAKRKADDAKRQRLAVLKAREDRKRAEAEAKRRADEEAARRNPALSITPGSGKSFRDRLTNGQPCPTCPEMVVVPAGSFTMGSPASEPQRDVDEAHVRAKIARPFAVGKFAITFDQWDACVAAGGCNRYRPADQGWGRGKRPVINVNWDEAKAYAGWLSRKTGKTYRLLSETEWEYVARAGTTTPFWWGSSITPKQANYNGNYTYEGGGSKGEYRQRTVPVDRFKANAWGLYNVHGNVLGMDRGLLA